MAGVLKAEIDFASFDNYNKDVVARDKRKADLCKENNVKLIYWKFDEVISKSKLEIKGNK